MRNVHYLGAGTALYIVFLLFAGCVTTPDGRRQLSETGKVALQEVASIAVRRSLSTSPRAPEKSMRSA